jgi:hypothetical protein
MNRQLKKLMNAQSKYDSVIGNVEAELSNKVGFEFSIFWQPSDGFVMLAFDSKNAALAPILDIIKKKGFLNEDDYLKHSI